VLSTSRRSGARLETATRLFTARSPRPRHPADPATAPRALSAVRDGGQEDADAVPAAATAADANAKAQPTRTPERHRTAQEPKPRHPPKPEPHLKQEPHSHPNPTL
ncbi:hypothetical protein, partial [Streptomyces sp. SP18CS02]|uniref:hypothetical protein n=1 Tax=Streptomyces sp. SP18CS02 TaxID=3002531 RepID=UPI002E773CE8